MQSLLGVGRNQPGTGRLRTEISDSSTSSYGSNERVSPTPNDDVSRHIVSRPAASSPDVLSVSLALVHINTVHVK